MQKERSPEEPAALVIAFVKFSMNSTDICLQTFIIIIISLFNWIIQRAMVSGKQKYNLGYETTDCCPQKLFLKKGFISARNCEAINAN